jgi:hypothetical protein
MQRIGVTLIAVVVLVCSLTGVASAQRHIVVNGQRLNAAEIRYLEQWTCTPIPNGAYWLNVHSGIWGYAGNPIPQGHISDSCRRQARRPSLSERGLLYAPGEILRGRP